MMRIADTRGVRTTAKRAKPRPTSGSAAFSVEQASSMPPLVSTSPIQTLQSIDALLSVQSVEDPLVGRRKALQRGEEMLDILEKLKIDMLAGHLSTDRLSALLQTVSKRTPSGNPEIDGLLEEIELRARVELAKLGKFAA